MPRVSPEASRLAAAEYARRARSLGLRRLTQWVPVEDYEQIEKLLAPYTREAKNRLKNKEEQLELLPQDRLGSRS